MIRTHRDNGCYNTCAGSGRALLKTCNGEVVKAKQTHKQKGASCCCGGGGEANSSRALFLLDVCYIDWNQNNPPLQKIKSKRTFSTKYYTVVGCCFFPRLKLHSLGGGGREGRQQCLCRFIYKKAIVNCSTCLKVQQAPLCYKAWS